VCAPVSSSRNSTAIESRRPFRRARSRRRITKNATSREPEDRAVDGEPTPGLEPGTPSLRGEVSGDRLVLFGSPGSDEAVRGRLVPTESSGEGPQEDPTTSG
jgi:hypothetical protein